MEVQAFLSYFLAKLPIEPKVFDWRLTTITRACNPFLNMHALKRVVVFYVGIFHYFSFRVE